MIISIIQMNVRIELGDHKRDPAVALSHGGPQTCAEILSKIISKYIYIYIYILRAPERRRLSPVSEPFSDEHGNESFRPTCRDFNFAAESP